VFPHSSEEREIFLAPDPSGYPQCRRLPSAIGLLILPQGNKQAMCSKNVG
jgi:hypothetical protein